MEVPMLINVLLGLVAFFGGLWVRHLQASQRRLEAEVSALRERVADGCVRRDDYVQLRQEMLAGMHVLREKLDRLAERLGISK